ncbi:MAG: cadmium-translocating P-type ATPase [Gemmatimonadetes bacterium]|nr:cadmium-translocating P-type ATPase [Gemmatimonadota bacterium]
MDCPGCAANVERALQNQDGIRELSISVVGQKATIHFDPALTDATRLADTIRGAGYTVEVEAPPIAANNSFWKDREKLLTILSGLFFFAALTIEFLYPETDHRPFWQGHLGPVDVLFLIASLIGGLNFFPQGLRALRRLSLDMDFLMTAAIFGAVFIGEYAEAAAIAFLFSTAELLEDYAIDRARHSLRALVELAPETAVVRRDGREQVVSAEEVSIGEIALVRPGDKLPVDGVVTEGSSTIDQSTITGESMPVARRTGDPVFAGTLNQEGYLEVEATQVAGSTALGRIIQMVEQAEERRAPSEQFVRRFARYYTPAVTLLALAVIAVPPLFFAAPFHLWFVRGLTLLVIACPCALVISTPVAVVSAITSAARNGVLIKGGIYLEALAHVSVVAFDKTGTLTRGRPQVTDVLPLNGLPQDEVLRLAAAAEQRSQHPIGRAIVEHADGTSLPEVSEFEAIAGQGVRATIGAETYQVGRPELFAENAPAQIEELSQQGKTVVLLGNDTEVIGAIAVADSLRPEAGQTIRALRDRNLKVVMLTGDNPTTAAAIAAELGIDEWRAELLPEHKVDIVEELSRTHGPVAMIGDGVNDAPALATASVGIAMGAIGSDVALETADVALMGDDLTRLPYLFHLSRRGNRVIRQNVWSSLLIKFSLALGVFPGIVTLAAAVLVGDAGTALGVTANALRLSRIRPR